LVFIKKIMRKKLYPKDIPAVQRFFGAILSFWGIVSFTSTFFVIFLPSMFCYLVPGKKGQWWFILISKFWMRNWLRLMGCGVTVKGTKNFAEGKAYIVTCNHNALIDVPLSSPFIPGPNKTIAKSTFTKVPIFGWYYRKGSVILDRNSEVSKRKSYEEMKQVLADGMHMCIYPEGTRNKTKEPLKPFYDGAFKLAVDTNTAVIPAVILNTALAQPIHVPFYFWPHKLAIHFLSPIESTGKTSKELKEEVFEVMKAYYEHN